MYKKKLNNKKNIKKYYQEKNYNKKYNLQIKKYNIITK